MLIKNKNKVQLWNEIVDDEKKIYNYEGTYKTLNGF